MNLLHTPVEIQYYYKLGIQAMKLQTIADAYKNDKVQTLATQFTDSIRKEIQKYHSLRGTTCRIKQTNIICTITEDSEFYFNMSSSGEVFVRCAIRSVNGVVNKTISLMCLDKIEQ